MSNFKRTLSLLFLSFLSIFLFSGFIYEDQSFDPSSDAWKIVNPSFVNIGDIVENNKRHEVLVAVLDSGIDYTHPALVKNMHYNLKELGPYLKTHELGKDDDGDGVADDFLGYDFSGKDGFPSYRLYSHANGKRDLKTEIKQTTSHGTHVAGIIAHGDARIGILPYRVLPFSIEDIRDSERKYTSTGESIAGLFATTLMKSLLLAKRQGARVANMSVGVNASDAIPGPVLHRAFRKLEKYMKKAASNMVLVIAAGNESTDISTGNKIYPCQAHSANVICVGSIAKDASGISGFSNIGLQYVDIFAPGENILSTVPVDHVHKGQKPFMEMSGTSMASPMVAGVIARMLIRNACLGAKQIASLLKKSATKATAKVQVGNSKTENYPIRMLNPKRAIEMAQNASCE